MHNAHFSVGDIASILGGSGGQFRSVVTGIVDLITPRQQLQNRLQLQVFQDHLSARNVASMLTGAGGNFGRLLQHLLRFVTPQAPNEESALERILDHGQLEGLTPVHIAHILDSAGGTFNNLVENLETFFPPPEPGALSTFQELLIAGDAMDVTTENLARALAGAGNRFNALVEIIRDNILNGNFNWDRRIRHNMYALKETRQADYKSRQGFVFDAPVSPMLAKVPARYDSVGGGNGKR